MKRLWIETSSRCHSWLAVWLMESWVLWQANLIFMVFESCCFFKLLCCHLWVLLESYIKVLPSVLSCPRGSVLDFVLVLGFAVDASKGFCATDVCRTRSGWIMT